MLKRKMFWMLLVATAGVARLGLECLPEPDLSFNLLGQLFPRA